MVDKKIIDVYRPYYATGLDSSVPTPRDIQTDLDCHSDFMIIVRVGAYKLNCPFLCDKDKILSSGCALS